MVLESMVYSESIDFLLVDMMLVSTLQQAVRS